MGEFCSGWGSWINNFIDRVDKSMGSLDGIMGDL